MIRSGRDILRQIRLGEDTLLELKSVSLSGNRIVGPRRDDIADELAAIANEAGGTVVLGVDDKTREILGIPMDMLDVVETWLRDVCNDLLRPPLNATILRLELPNVSGTPTPVIVVEIPRSLYVHRSPGGYFGRIGSSKREMPAEALARLFQERSQSRVIRFDESTVPGTRLEDLDETLTQRFLPSGVSPYEEYIRKLRIAADDDDGEPRLTVAGVLMCTSSPEPWLPHAYIQAVSYAGERRDSNYQVDARDIVGPLDVQVAEALQFVVRNMRIGATKPVARTDRPQFSERAVFEALVNAVAHRDYTMAGARIRLHMFRDRLELYVPGGLANTLTIDSLHLRQHSRNELIVSLLTRCAVPGASAADRTHMMERRGEGVPIILKESERLSGRLPEYTLIDNSELRLVIWAAPPVVAD